MPFDGVHGHLTNKIFHNLTTENCFQGKISYSVVVTEKKYMLHGIRKLINRML
jgi:hypothetical protein